MAVRDLPSRPNLEQYRKQAKELLKRWKASDPKTTRRLADAQLAVYLARCGPKQRLYYR